MTAFDKDSSAGYLANHLARLFARRLHEGIAPLGLAPAQFMCLLELWREDGLTQRQLTERLDVEQATMANTLSRMDRDGLVTRRLHPSDARARTIHLTDRARMLERPAQEAARAVNAAALGALPEDRRDAVLSDLSAMIAVLRDPRPEPP